MILVQHTLVVLNVAGELPALFDHAGDFVGPVVTIETYRLHNWQQIPIVELRS